MLKALQDEQLNEPRNASLTAMRSFRLVSRCQNDAFGVSDTFCDSYAASVSSRSRVDVEGDVAAARDVQDDESGAASG